VLLWQLTRREGIRLFDLVGFERARLVRDALLGFTLIPVSLAFILGGNYATAGSCTGRSRRRISLDRCHCRPRCTAFWWTLIDDPCTRSTADARCQTLPIYSPDVPIFRIDQGTALPAPWLLSFLTCAAPYAPDIGQPQAGDLLQKRTHRVLAIARAFGHVTLVLGAWGCGAFENDFLGLSVMSLRPGTVREFAHPVWRSRAMMSARLGARRSATRA
jgi:hypothetical protein